MASASPIAFSVAFRMVGDEDIAKDIVQDTMVTIWEKIRNIKSPEAFKTWLYRITYNKCCDYLRKKKGSGVFFLRMDKFRLAKSDYCS